MQAVQAEFPVFLGEGMKAIGAVREVHADKIVIYVENAGEFEIPASAVASVHDSKVALSLDSIGPELAQAIRHMHDREDPRLAV